MKTPRDRLYELLPQYIRYRDQHVGEPLRALMEVLEIQFRQLEETTTALYEDAFVETCDLARLPYIGDLLAVRGLSNPGEGFLTRARVANALAYRQRKGVAAALERTAAAATDWGAKLEEHYPLRVRTQDIQHPEPGQGGLFDVSSEVQDSARENLPTRGPIGTMRTVDVRSTLTGNSPVEKCSNTPDVCLRLWRLASFPVYRASPRQQAIGLYTFDPFGEDIPLFNQPRPLAEIAAPTKARNLPALLDPKVLQAEIDDLRLGREPSTGYFSPPPVLQVFFEGHPVPPEGITITSLENWQRPDGQTYQQHVADGAVEREVQAFVDPVLGRLAVTEKAAEGRVEASYSYGFSDAIGGGPYSRADSLTPIAVQAWWAVVDSNAHPDMKAAPQNRGVFDRLEDAVETWLKSDAEKGHIRILDNATYFLPGSILAIDLDGRELVIEAADGRRPTIVGDLRIFGAPASPAPNPDARLTLGGLWLDGRIRIERGGVDLVVVDCTLKPPAPTEPPRPSLEGASSSCRVSIRRCILGPIRLSANSLGLRLEDSIVDAGLKHINSRRCALCAARSGLDGDHPGPPTVLKRATIFGRAILSRLEAEDVIFVDPVKVTRRQEGWVRYCYLPPGSRTPPRSNMPRRSGRLRLDGFTQATYGAPGYAQLSNRCPEAIRTGGSEGSEIGVFHRLLQPQREANLPRVLSEYVRWPLAAQYKFAT